MRSAILALRRRPHVERKVLAVLRGDPAAARMGLRSSRRRSGSDGLDRLDPAPADELRAISASHGLRIQPPGTPYVCADELLLLRWLAGAQRLVPLGARPSDVLLARAVSRCAWMLDRAGLRLAPGAIHASVAPVHENRGAALTR